MLPDKEGFLYPNIDNTLCINCKKCEHTCPVINKEKNEIQILKSDDPNFRQITALPADGTPVKMYVDYIRVYKENK